MRPPDLPDAQRQALGEPAPPAAPPMVPKRPARGQLDPGQVTAMRNLWAAVLLDAIGPLLGDPRRAGFREALGYLRSPDFAEVASLAGLDHLVARSRLEAQFAPKQEADT